MFLRKSGVTLQTCGEHVPCWKGYIAGADLSKGSKRASGRGCSHASLHASNGFGHTKPRSIIRLYWSLHVLLGFQWLRPACAHCAPPSCDASCLLLRPISCNNCPTSARLPGKGFGYLLTHDDVCLSANALPSRQMSSLSCDAAPWKQGRLRWRVLAATWDKGKMGVPGR